MKYSRRILFTVLVSLLVPTLSAGQVNDFVGEGVGIRGIMIGVSTRDQIVADFGGDYEVVMHKDYSTEIVYKKIGVSFYFCRADPKQEVFVIDLEPPFSGITSKGVVLGKSTEEEVRRLYKSDDQMDFIGSGDDSFEGIGFSYGIIPDRPDKEVVNEIEIFEREGLRQCHVKFPKPEDK